MKPEFPTFYVTLARVTYAVECKVTLPKAAPHVGPDHPQYMSPGSPLRVRVIRILRDRVDVGRELLWHTREGIRELIELEAVARYCRSKKARGGAQTVCADQVAVIPLEADETGQLRLLEDSR